MLWVWMSLAQWLGLFMFKAEDGRILMTIAFAISRASHSFAFQAFQFHNFN